MAFSLLSEEISTSIKVFSYFCICFSVNSIAYGVGLRYMDLGGQRLFHKAYMFADFPSCILFDYFVADVAIRIVVEEIWCKAVNEG